MKNFQHLTKNQILAYSDDSLNEFESQEIGRHLLNCEICRQSLPIPTVEQFWSAIMNDKEEIEKAGVEKTVEVSSEKTGFSSFLNFHSNLIWSGATLIVLISFSFLIWLNIANSNREVAVIINTEMHVTRTADTARGRHPGARRATDRACTTRPPRNPTADRARGGRGAKAP